MQRKYKLKVRINENHTTCQQKNREYAWKVYVFRVVLVRIFQHLDWIRKDTDSISMYSVRMRENADQNNSEYGYFLRSVNS